jgi:hypothetical protein
VSPHFYRFAVLLALTLLLGGCSYASVGHLQRQPWVLNTHQQLEMRFWRFSFIAESIEGHYTVAGRAAPVMESLPEGLGWIEDLWLVAYLCDEQGRVLAQDLRVFSGLPLDPAQGVLFMFTLKPDQLSRSSSLQITFGYNMTLTPHQFYTVEDVPEKLPLGERTGVFFAHEGALTRI